MFAPHAPRIPLPSRLACVLVALIAAVVTFIPRCAPARISERDSAGDPRPPGSALLYADSIDANTAGVEDLATLPGVGEAKARRILDRRRAGFCSTEEMRRAAGLGERAWKRAEPRIRLTPGPACVRTSSSSG